MAPATITRNRSLSMLLVATVVFAHGVAGCGREPERPSVERLSTQLTFDGLRSVPELAVDSAGTVYALDTESDQVLSLAAGADSSTVLPFAEDLSLLSRLVVDAAGTVYVCDGISVFKLAPGAPSAQAFGFGATDTGEPVFIADFTVDAHGSIFAVTDFVVAPQSTPNTVLELPVGSSTPLPLPFHDMGRPDRIAVDGDANVYVQDSLNNRILVLSQGADREIALPVTGRVRGMTVDAGGNVYSWNRTDNRVMELRRGATAPSVLPFDGLDTISEEIALDSNGAVYVPDSGNGRVLKWEPGAKNATDLPIVFEPDHPGLFAPQSLAIDSDDSLYVATSFNGIILKLKQA